MNASNNPIPTPENLFSQPNGAGKETRRMKPVICVKFKLLESVSVTFKGIWYKTSVLSDVLDQQYQKYINSKKLSKY